MNATQVYGVIRAFGEHEHLDLARGLDRIHDAGCRLGSGLHIDDARAIRDVLRWTASILQPHIDWEEAWLYPRIDAMTGTTWATRAARFDHAQIAGLGHRLQRDAEMAADGLTPIQTAEVRGHLFAYEALLRTHVEREEQLLLPVLDDDVELRT